MKSEVYRNYADGDFTVATRISDYDLAYATSVVWDRLITTVTNRLADEFMRLHGQELLAKMDPQAMANMAAIALGKKALKDLL